MGHEPTLGGVIYIYFFLIYIFFFNIYFFSIYIIFFYIDREESPAASSASEFLASRKQRSPSRHRLPAAPAGKRRQCPAHPEKVGKLGKNRRGSGNGGKRWEERRRSGGRTAAGAAGNEETPIKSRFNPCDCRRGSFFSHFPLFPFFPIFL